jgi:hypothetical protein
LKTKKPTSKQIETVLSKIIIDMQQLEHKIISLDNALGMYIKYKNEDIGFREYVDKQLKEMKGNEGSN